MMERNDYRRVANEDLYYIARRGVQQCSEILEAESVAELEARFSRLNIGSISGNRGTL
jgi:hypothetical protein